VHDLQNDTVNLIDGVRAAMPPTPGGCRNFTANLTPIERQTFNADSRRTASRSSMRTSQQPTPRSDWGRDTLRAVEFAFYVLNTSVAGSPRGGGRKRRSFNPANTIVIASSVSNGGGAALAAAEIDRHGLIDGVAVSEPNIQVRAAPTR
jgi:hydroxybutyrate-dimer hydrolase